MSTKPHSNRQFDRKIDLADFICSMRRYRFRIRHHMARFRDIPGFVSNFIAVFPLARYDTAMNSK